MARESAPPTLAELARRQWGVVTRGQLLASGLGESGLRDWVRAGRLHRLYRGVYAVGHDRLRLEGRWLAAVFACGPGAVLSHRDAAALWELRQSNSAYIDVTVPSRNGRRGQRGIRLHRTGRLRPDELAVRNGIPVTTVARTLLDLADILEGQALRRVITEADYTQQFDLTAINAVVQNNPGRRSARLLEAVGGRRHRTRSPLELRFLRLLERHRVEEPESGVWIEGYEADFLWRAARLVVETDGLDAHSTPEAVQRDRRRDRVHARAGLRTMRLTDDDLDDEEAVLDDLAHAGVKVPSRSRASSKPPRRSRTSPARVT
jgi:very-short-patch-repair endonuclease